MHESQLKTRERQQENRQAKLEALAKHLLETEQFFYDKKSYLFDLD